MEMRGKRSVKVKQRVSMNKTVYFGVFIVIFALVVCGVSAIYYYCP